MIDISYLSSRPTIEKGDSIYPARSGGARCAEKQGLNNAQKQGISNCCIRRKPDKKRTSKNDVLLLYNNFYAFTIFSVVFSILTVVVWPIAEAEKLIVPS